MPPPPIVLKKVRVHNLKSVDLTLQPGQLIVFTGVSGSGKSSLAFDVIYVEGQRRYIESLSHQMRRNLVPLPKPEAESISGIAPTIAVEQKHAGNTPRSTVGTMSGIYDFLRVLYARIGIPHCPVSGESVAAQSREQMIARLERLPRETKCIVLSPYARGRRGEFREDIAELLSKGFTRLRVDGEWVELGETDRLDGTKLHDVDLVIDRFVVDGTNRARIIEAISSALDLGKGLCSVYTGDEIPFSEHAHCAKSGLSYGPLEPHDFSFNHPKGMCPTCSGLGGDCPSCRGARIKPYPAAVQLHGKTITQLCAMTLTELSLFFRELTLSEIDRTIAEELLNEMQGRIACLLRVGLHYLSLDRTSPSLSGGESQRVRLAAHIGAGLVGAIYVLDEPSIGLHPTDHGKLIGALQHLKDQGNTVIVVEHDNDTILAADSVVDVGPGAGVHGGRILVHGTHEEVMRCPESLTGDYLAGRRKIEIPKTRRVLTKELSILGATHHNLKNIDVSLPLGGLVCVTGVSGSGKSSLISDILVPALSNALHRAKLSVGAHKEIRGIEHLDKIIAVDQAPIGRTPRSNAATYIKLFDEIRDLFAELPESKQRGFMASHFSFNVKEGSCAYCAGLGEVAIDMDFMEDAFVVCPQCKGKRFDPEILDVKFKGHSIADILELDVEHARALFGAVPQIDKKLQVLSEVGLDYLKLGQPATTLSGGEAQRIKLASELVRPASKNTLYVLDEPTTGLHFHDVARLIAVLQRLVDKGGSVLVVEHNMDLVKTADYVIDLGPGAGVEGGQIAGRGTPETIAKKKSATGIALRDACRWRAPEPKAWAKEAQEPKYISIGGARQNNLKGVDLEIPRGKITVFTGPSGSGKSSLAFETIYAEGQRRYAETLPARERQHIKQMPKPKVDLLEGLSPSIALEQKAGGLNPRSTVGTLTEIYDLLRLLYAHLGIPHCPESGEEIRHISKEYVVQKILALPHGEKIHVLLPLAMQKKESFEELCERMHRQGFLRIRLNGVYYELDEPIPFEKAKKNEMFLVVDRMFVDLKNEKRLFEAVAKSDGVIVVAKEFEDLYFNLAFAAPKSGKSYPPITPQTFSFNAASGMCQECQGLGIVHGATFDERKKFARLSILDVCALLFKERGGKESQQFVEQYFRTLDIEADEPIKNLSEKAFQTFLSGGEEVKMRSGLRCRWSGLSEAFAKIARLSNRRLRDALLPSLIASPCPACCGARLNPLARKVTIQGVSISELCDKSLERAYAFIQTLNLTKHPFLQETHAQLLKSLSFLLSIGTGYLSLSRSAPTLSGGELQRIRLARQLGSGLTSCLYVLDEPTIGLHPYNNELLNAALNNLCQQGNTLILVEHDPLTVAKADFLVDFGPKAGKAGGQITAFGTLEQIRNNPNSLTGDYLTGRKAIPLPATRRPFAPDIRIEHANLHNLADISVAFPKSAITCLTGVSGSGKSSLMRHLLQPAAEKSVKARKKVEPINYLGASFYGLSSFEKVVCIDQSPIGQTPRANVSTYTDIHPLLRAHFAELPAAKVRGLQPRHFSSNHWHGVCKRCIGFGFKTIDLQFLPSVRVPCDACHGYRLNPLSLEVRYKGNHMGEVLELPVEEALRWFADIPKIAHPLETLCEVGLPYLQLGQGLTTLSGGEAQRLRLSRELAKRESGKSLYLIDEPTVGLHSEDIAKLLPIFHRLADKKNTLLIIEHNLDVIASADYLIDLGPDAGADGGRVIAQGTPEEVAQSAVSKIAPFLRERLQL